jgi:hypothetical protein
MTYDELSADSPAATIEDEQGRVALDAQPPSALPTGMTIQKKL